MRDINDMKNAFGEADDGFKNNVYRTLSRLQQSEERKPMRRISFRLAIAIAVACSLITTTVFAALTLSNTWGIRDFLANRFNIEVLPDAAEIIQTDMPQNGGQLDLVTFTVREAIFDGHDVYIIVEARPSRPEYLLLGTDASPSDPIANLGPLFEDKSGTIADYAHDNNKIMIHTWVNINIDGSKSADFLLEEDGALVYKLGASFDGDGMSESDVTLLCGVADFTNRDEEYLIDSANGQTTTLTATLQNSGTTGALTSADPVDFSSCGVRADEITLTGSPMAVYVEIEYTVIDKEKFAGTDGGLRFELVDEKGERLPFGASSSGVSGAVDDTGTRFIQRDSLRAMEVLPRKIILRAYNVWDQNRYETHTFEMK